MSAVTKPFLAIEWLQPGEGEDTAALRLLEKLPDLYGSRFFDLLLLDALYGQAPVLKLADRIGWDVVISLKQNQRELYQSAVRLFASRPADCSGVERHEGKGYQFQIRDSQGLQFSVDHPQPARVVRSEETLTQNITAAAGSNPKRPSTNGSGYDLGCAGLSRQSGSPARP